MKIAFYISGKATRLIKILEDNRFSKIKESIMFVFSDNIKKENINDCIKNIPLYGIQFNKLNSNTFSKNEELSNNLLDKLEKYQIDYCFSFGDHILKGKILIKFKNKIINFHPSVLPSFKGRKSIDKAVDNYSFLLGNTAHFIDEGIDSGPIIMQNIVHHTQFNCNYENILDNQIDMFYQIFDWLLNDRLYIENNYCKIKDSEISNIIYFPKLEN